MNGGPPAQPMPYFDDDDMIDDYVDDDDFGGPPPPPTTAKPAITTDEYNNDFWEDMMEFEGQRQQEEAATSATLNAKPTTTATATSPVSTLDLGGAPDMALEENEEQQDPDIGNENEISLTNINSSNHDTVEEYLAARRQENNLYNFER